MRACTVNNMTLIGRELTEDIDILIGLRIQEHDLLVAGAEKIGSVKDDIEVCKRNITDSLLAMDSRRGVYLDDSKKHERKA